MIGVHIMCLVVPHCTVCSDAVILFTSSKPYSADRILYHKHSLMHAYLCFLVCLTSPSFLVRLWWVSRELIVFNTLRTRSFKLFKRPFPGFLTILTL